MKATKLFSVLVLALLAGFVACGKPPIPDPQPKEGDDTSKVEGKIVAIPSSITIPEGAITVGEARDIASKLESGATSGTKYYIHGWVKKLHSNHNADNIEKWGNGQFYMSENKYEDGTYDNDDFMAYQVYGLNGQKLVSVDQVAEGDYVVLYGEITNYNGTYETVGKGAAYIYASTNPNIDKGETPDPINIDYLEGELSVSDFLALNAIANLEVGTTTEERYTVRGKVTDANVNLGYGSATFYITDGVNSLYCYGIVDVDSTQFVNGERLVDGDIVTVYAQVQNYLSSKEGAEPVIELVKGWITRTTNTTEPGQAAEIKVITLKEAREIALALPNQGKTTEQYQFSGIVSLTPKEFTKTKVDISTQFGNLTFCLVDENGENEFVVYRAYYIDNKKYTENDPAFEDGDVVTIIGQLMNYNGTPETPQGGAYVSEHVK